MSVSPSAQLITNATVAQYIHEISVRHRRRDPEWWARRGAGALADEATAASGVPRGQQAPQPAAA
jgi:hypothetical protein